MPATMTACTPLVSYTHCVVHEHTVPWHPYVYRYSLTVGGCPRVYWQMHISTQGSVSWQSGPSVCTKCQGAKEREVVELNQ